MVTFSSGKQELCHCWCTSTPTRAAKSRSEYSEGQKATSQRTSVAISKLYRHPGLIKDHYHHYFKKKKKKAISITAELETLPKRSGDEWNLQRPSSGQDLLLHLQGLFYLALLTSAAKCTSARTEGISVLPGICLARSTNSFPKLPICNWQRGKEQLDPGFRLGCKVIPVFIMEIPKDPSEANSFSV